MVQLMVKGSFNNTRTLITKINRK